MKVLLKSDGKTVLFLSGSATLNANDEMWQALDVELETPLIEGRESIWVVFQNVDEATLLTNDIMLEKSEDGHYRTQIPDGVIVVPGDWTFQLLTKTYDLVSESWLNRMAADVSLFTIEDGLPISNGQKVNNATIGALYAESQQAIKTATEQAQNVEVTAQALKESVDKIDLLETNKVSKTGDTMTGPLVVDVPSDVDVVGGRATIDGDGFTTSTNFNTAYYKDKTEYKRGKIKHTHQIGPSNIEEYDYTFPEKSGTLALDGDVTEAKEEVLQVVDNLPDNLTLTEDTEAEDGTVTEGTKTKWQKWLGVGGGGTKLYKHKIFIDQDSTRYLEVISNLPTFKYDYTAEGGPCYIDVPTRDVISAKYYANNSWKLPACFFGGMDYAEICYMDSAESSALTYAFLTLTVDGYTVTEL